MPMTETDYEYIGGELELFSGAVNWKRYLFECVRPFLGETVFEVGAGIGGTTRAFAREEHARWLCIEPDETLLRSVEEKIGSGELPAFCQPMHGTLADLPDSERADSILYTDVLEHIEDDREEIGRAVEHLRVGGHLIVLCPAHQSLFSPFDEAVGHYRRYDKGMLRNLTHPRLRLVRLWYLDSVGMLASVMNSKLLQQKMPTKQQVELWDRWMVRSSRLIDLLLGHSFGKSILGVWQLAE
jgi:SAM-dependent methyltransferase